MAKFNVVVAHSNERQVVVERLRSFSERIKADMPGEVGAVEESWDATGNLSFAFKAMGMKISGTMVTCAVQVTVAGQLPFAALPFRGAIEKQIEQKVIEAIELS